MNFKAYVQRLSIIALMVIFCSPLGLHLVFAGQSPESKASIRHFSCGSFYHWISRINNEHYLHLDVSFQDRLQRAFANSLEATQNIIWPSFNFESDSRFCADTLNVLKHSGVNPAHDKDVSAVLLATLDSYLQSIDPHSYTQFVDETHELVGNNRSDPVKESWIGDDRRLLHIKVNYFGGATTQKIKEILKESPIEILGVKLPSRAARGIVLDLRNNPGGDVEDGVNTAGLFVGNKIPLLFEKRRNQKPKIAKEVSQKKVTDLPLVVLVNRKTASIAEAVAGILQDTKRGILIGTPTFGKANLQDYYYTMYVNPKTDRMQKFLIFITASVLFTPSGKSYQSNGVEPDVLIGDKTTDFKIQDRIERAALKGKSVVLYDREFENALPAQDTVVVPKIILDSHNENRIMQAILAFEVEKLVSTGDVQLANAIQAINLLQQ